jgi:hypothetical protein
VRKTALDNYFEKLLKKLHMEPWFRGGGDDNLFDPGFGLVGQERFQYGDLRKNLDDRVVIVEVERQCSRTLSNLAKFWPLAQSGDRLPHLLLHVFARHSQEAADISHLKLWDFVWEDMKKELWIPKQMPKLLAARFTHALDDYAGIEVACEVYERCLTEPLEKVCRKDFGWPGY